MIGLKKCACENVEMTYRLGHNVTVSICLLRAVILYWPVSIQLRSPAAE